jgi:hypothetical protein
MGTHKVNFIKSNNHWFIDFIETELTPKINGVNQQHLRPLVGGWDTWLEIVSEGSDNFWMTVSDSPILNGTEINRIDKTNNKEVYYGSGIGFNIESYKGIILNMDFFICSNGLDFIFGNIPSSWYFIRHD